MSVSVLTIPEKKTRLGCGFSERSHLTHWKPDLILDPG